MSTQWEFSLSDMAQSMELYAAQVEEAVVEVAEFIAAKMQGIAHQEAPWEDDTGAARDNLFGVVIPDVARRMVDIYLSHGDGVFTEQEVPHSIFLETANEEEYAIIMPVMEEHYSELEQMLQRIFQ